MDERGSVTFWMLGLAMCVLTIGVLAVDLWDLMANRRELAVIADSAAVAAASAIDEGAWRSGSGIVLDPRLASDRALAIIHAHREVTDEIELPSDWISVDPLAGIVEVRLVKNVDASLLGLLGRETTRIGASSQATATRR